MKKTLVLSILLLLFAGGAWAEAIVNVEDLRKEGEVGFFSSLSLSLNGSRGNVHRNFYSINLRFDNNSENQESFLILQKSQRKRNQKLMVD